MYLFDTNIFLEILLSQKKCEDCKRILATNMGHIWISDFSLHSIGVILFKHRKDDIFEAFASDVVPKVKIATLSKDLYRQLPDIHRKYNLDFDDAYQFKIAEANGFEIFTMDSDFNTVKEKIKVTNI